MSQNTTWEINGVSLTIDLQDADQMERYEEAFEKMSADEQTIPKDGKASARIRAYCTMFRNLYDHIFGAGTSDRIFAGQPMSTVVYDIVYESFLGFVQGQLVSASERRDQILQKYRPNREQRRAEAAKKPRRTK